MSKKVAADRRLSKGQIKILQALKKHGPLTRKALAEKTELDQSGFCIAIGYIGDGTDTMKNYVTGHDLYTRGYVRGDYQAEQVKGKEDPRDVYYDRITASGEKALEKALVETKEREKGKSKPAAKKAPKPAAKKVPAKKAHPKPVRKAPAPSPAEAAAV